MKAKRSDRRARELAAIHAKAKQLGLDRETYEAMLETVTSVRSAGALDDAGRARVLDHLSRLLLSSGERTSSERGAIHRSGAASRDRSPLLNKVRALLNERSRGMEYADGIARHMFAVDRVEWCKPDQLRSIVAALVYDQRRHRDRTKEAR